MTRFEHTDWITPPEDPHGIGENVRRLTRSILSDRRISHLGRAPRPDRAATAQLAERLLRLMFFGFFDETPVAESSVEAHVMIALAEINDALVRQITAALAYVAELDPESAESVEEDTAPVGTGPLVKAGGEVDASELIDRARGLTGRFIDTLPRVRETLSLDVQAAYDGDPAATHVDEIILCYPGLRALAIHRIAHELYRLGVPLLPRIMHETAHGETGIDIHPGARIGTSFFIDHGTGVVIGETTEIGDGCKIYQGVTLGAKSFPRDERGRVRRGLKRHPTLDDHVTVYAGATILGGDTVIGAGSVVSGGVFLTTSVPPGHVVRGPRTEITLRNNPDMPPAMYSI